MAAMAASSRSTIDCPSALVPVPRVGRVKEMTSESADCAG